MNSLLALFCCLGLALASFEVREHLGTKTPYIETTMIDTPPPEGCQPIHINILSRHGSREPTDSTLDKFDTLSQYLANISDQITNKDFAWMKTWVNPHNRSDSGLLSRRGELEQYNIAKRLLQRFPALFSMEPGMFFESFFDIQSTAVSRAGRSANAFAFGLFEGTGNIGESKYEPFNVYSQSLNIDFVLYPHKNCPAYQKWSKAKSWETEARSYDAVLASIVPKVQRKLGISSWNMTLDELNAIAEACASDLYENEDPDHFCQLLDAEDIKAFEFSEDLETYYQFGPGSAINTNLSALLLQDIFNTIQNKIDNPKTLQRARIRFAHAETLMPFSTILGLFNTTKMLTHNMTKEDARSRSWRTSSIVPFSSNFAFVLYECQTPVFDSPTPTPSTSFGSSQTTSPSVPGSYSFLPPASDSATASSPPSPATPTASATSTLSPFSTSPAASVSSTQSPASTPSTSPAASASSTQSPAVSASSTQAPAASASSTQSPAASASSTQSPASAPSAPTSSASPAASASGTQSPASAPSAPTSSTPLPRARRVRDEERPSTKHQTTYVVKLLHNEQEILFPACDSVYCSLDTLKKAYADRLSADFFSFCQSTSCAKQAYAGYASPTTSPKPSSSDSDSASDDDPDDVERRIHKRVVTAVLITIVGSVFVIFLLVVVFVILLRRQHNSATRGYEPVHDFSGEY